MNYIKKHKRFIIFLLVFAALFFFILPSLQVGYGAQEQAKLDYYATRISVLLLVIGWVSLNIFFVFKEGFRSLGYVLFSTALSLLPLFFVLSPILQAGVYFANSATAGQRSTRNFRVISAVGKDHDISLLSADSMRPSTLLLYSDVRGSDEGDTLVLIARSGVFGVKRYTLR